MTWKIGWRVGWAILTLALALYAFGATRAYQQAKAAEKRAEEALTLAEVNIATANQVPDLRDVLEKVLSEFTQLSEQYEALKNATPDAEPTTVVTNEGPVITLPAPSSACPLPTDSPDLTLPPVELPPVKPFSFRVFNAVVVSETKAGTIAVTGETQVTEVGKDEPFASWAWDAANTSVTVKRKPQLDYERHTFGIRPIRHWRTGWTVGLGAGKSVGGEFDAGVWVIWGIQF